MPESPDLHPQPHVADTQRSRFVTMAPVPPVHGARPAIGRWMPAFDAARARSIEVDADPIAVWRAIGDADIAGRGLLRALCWLRALPDLPGGLRRAPAKLRFRDLGGPDSPWQVLEQRRQVEQVIGAAGRFGKPRNEWRRLTAEQFRDLDQPGHGRIVIGVSLRPLGPGRTRLTCETRIRIEGAQARRRFRRTWALVGPLVAYGMEGALRAIEAEAG